MHPNRPQRTLPTRPPRVLVPTVLMLLAALDAPVADAQPLDEFLSAARNAGTRRRAAALDASARSAELDAARGGLLPSVSVRGGYTRNQYEAKVSIPDGSGGVDEAVIQPFDLLQGSLRVDVPLVDVGRWQRLGALESATEAARARTEDVTVTEARAVIRAFHDALAGERLEALSRRSLSVAEALVQDALHREQAGRGSSLEVERAKAQVGRERQRLAESTRRSAVARRRLESLTGIKPDALVRAPPVMSKDPSSATEAPSVRAARAEAETSRRNAGAAWATLLPRLSAFGAENLTNATGFVGQPATWALGLELDWRADLGALSTARALNDSAEAASLREAAARRDADDRIFEAQAEVALQVERVASAQAVEAAAARAAAFARDREAAGGATPLERLQAERDLADAESERVQAELDLDAARLLLRLETEPSRSSGAAL